MKKALILFETFLSQNVNKSSNNKSMRKIFHKNLLSYNLLL